MKKCMLFIVAALTLGSAAMAQTRIEIRDDIQLKRMENSDAEIADPAKAAKAKTWQNRGDIYREVGQGLSQWVFRSQPVRDLYMAFQVDPDSTREEIVRGKTYRVLSFKGVDIFTTMDSQLVEFWKITNYLREDAMDVALAAYQKAIELDPKLTKNKTIKENMNLAMNQLRQEADFALQAGDQAKAANFFGRIYDASKPPMFKIDTMCAYNAGNLYTVVQDYDNAIKYLSEALKLGYAADGEVYFYLFYAYKTTNQMDKAAAILEEGVLKYPENSKLVENLITVYTAEGKDPVAIIPLVEKAIAKDPKNHTLYYGLGLIYNKLGQPEKAKENFDKALNLLPNDAATIFNLAIIYMNQAEETSKEVIPINEKERLAERDKQVSEYYHQALPLLERAHILKPENGSIVDALKRLYFRYRDESPENQAKYEKYNEIYKKMVEAQQ